MAAAPGYRPPLLCTDAAGDPRPLYFGREGRPLFGWLHPAAPAAVGLVICNPFGDEAVRTHRSIRHLAISASNAGVPALRFDYDGTGDSAGHDLDPERVDQWLVSINIAADTLKQVAGVTCLCFAGIRLGATLATLAAAARTDVAGLIAIAPVVSGKSYVRELRLLQRAIASKRNIDGAATQDHLETAGFLLGARTLASLTSVDLQKSEQAPAPRVLILDRAEMPSGEKWAQRLSALGAQVDYSLVGGYTEMMLDSHESTVPKEIIGATTTWLRAVATDPPNMTRPAHSGTDTAFGRPATTDHATFSPSLVSDPLIKDPPRQPIEEHAVCFGGTRQLFGIVSVAQAAAARGATTAVILLNAGAVHHIGPGRLYVALARYLAELGYTVLRMDVASIGDSPPYPGQPEIDVYSPYALQDIAGAIEYLKRYWRAREVTSTGVCSGAYHSFKAAVARQPLAQVILINPLTFFWKSGMSLSYPEYKVAQDIQRYRKTALTGSAWRKLLTGRVDVANLARVLVRTARARSLGPIRSIARLLGRPLLEDLPTELRGALKGAIDLQFVFSAGDPGLALLRTQGGATMRRLQDRQQIGVALIDGADHTFTDLAARQTLVQVLVEKIRARLAPAPPGSHGHPS
jgi:alpha/beta superfamily hydrolase